MRVWVVVEEMSHSLTDNDHLSICGQACMWSDSLDLDTNWDSIWSNGASGRIDTSYVSNKWAVHSRFLSIRGQDNMNSMALRIRCTTQQDKDRNVHTGGKDVV